MSDTTENQPTVTEGAPSSKKWDRKTAQRYRLVHRSQEDPLINDPEAPTGVLVQLKKKNKKGEHGPVKYPVRPTGPSQVKTLKDLEAEKELFSSQRRENEGEAAMYGIGFDDSNYDYMQHLREIGREEDGSAVFIPSLAAQKASERLSRKTGQSVKFTEPDVVSSGILPAEVLPSEVVVKKTYQDQQDVPDAISGLQPDMDPDLREVLEALEDEAYVEDDEAVFTKIIAGDATDLDYEEEEDFFDDEDEEDEEDAGWERQFAKFKIEQSKAAVDSEDDLDDDDLASLLSFDKKAGKSRGSRSVTSGYSMSSSAMFRNAGLTLLDDRFDQIEKMYNESDDDDDEDEDEDDAQPVVNEDLKDGEANQTAGRKQIESAAFDAIMDDFLDNYNVVGKRLVREAPSGPTDSTQPSKPVKKIGRRGFDRRNTRGLNQLREIKDELGKPQTDYIKRRFRLAE